MSASRELHCQLNRIEPCLPRFAKKPPAGPGWIHEIKHDGFRIIAIRDGARVRLLTRKGIDLARRFAQIAAAIAVLPVRSCIIDGEAIACDANGLAVFELLRYRRQDHAVALCEFDLLELEGYEVSSAYDGVAALKAIGSEYFDLLILDVMLPEIDGINITETIRLQNIDVPILILSAKNTSADRVLGLKKGADDYLTKPFNLEELILRVQKLIEKNKKLQDRSSIGDTYSFGKNTVDFKAQEAITKSEEKVQLSRKESMLLKLLIENKNEVVPREKILQSVWGYNVYPTTRTIDNFILNFRKYFEEDSRNPKYFHSVRGVGYKYAE